MKIGRRIAFYYMWVTLGITGALVVVFYFYTSRYIDNVYYSYLAEKALVTAGKHWERDEVNAQDYALIQKRYNELLPTTREVIFNVDSTGFHSDSLRHYLTEAQVGRLKMREPGRFRHGQQLGVALFYPDNEGNFILLIFAENDYGQQVRQQVSWLMLLLLLVAVVVTYIAGKVYSDRILAPLQKILKKLKRITGNDLRVRFRPTGNGDELDDLTRSLNGMLDRVDAALSAEKSFVSNASHELNNPVTAIQGECEIMLMRSRTPEEYVAALERISTESRRLGDLTKALLMLSRQNRQLRQNTMEAVSLTEWLVRQCGENPRLILTVDPGGDTFPVVADPYLLGVALGNIIENACKYSQGNVAINLGRENGQTVVEVLDSGIGIPKDEIGQVFQSFYRARNSREYRGHGIGLNLSANILSSYGAVMEIVSEEGEYTRVRVRFVRE